MKRFLTVLITFVLILATLTFAVNALYLYQQNQIADTMSPMRNSDAVIRNVPEGIEVACFGSSHALLGLDFEDFDQNYVCFNFGQASQFISYDDRLLQYYLDHFKPGATVLITISHFSLFGKPDTEYDNFAALNKRYYKVLPDNLIKQYDAKTDFYVTKFPALAAEDALSLLSMLIGRNHPNTEWENSTNPEQAAVNAENRYKTFVESKRAADGSRLYNQEEIDALYHMIALCQENGLRPVLITTPYLSEYMDQIRENDPTFLDDFYGIIHHIVDETGVSFFDYSADNRFAENYELFHDADHLNRAGARCFTEILFREIVEKDAK